MNTKELIDEAISLPIDKRVLVVDSLLQSLNQPESEIDRKWNEVAQKRLMEMRAGKIESISGEQVFKKIWGKQARHATSQHSGTPVTNIHSPTQRMGDALVALRPSQLRTKPCSVKTTSNGWTAFGMQLLPPSRATSALRISELPCRLPGTKNHHSA